MATFLARGRPCTLLHPKSNGQEKINRGITLSSHEAIETSISKRDRNAENSSPSFLNTSLLLQNEPVDQSPRQIGCPSHPSAFI